MAYNFADSYRIAGLNPRPEILGLRQEPFNRLLSEAKAANIIELVRMQFGRPPSTEGLTEFSSAFHAADASFSVHENEREVAVLASCLLDALVAKGTPMAVLAILTMSAGGLRKPLVRGDLVSVAERRLTQLAIDARTQPAVEVGNIKNPTKSKTAAEAAALESSGDWAKTAELFSKISDEGYAAVKALADQVSSVVRPLAQRNADLREEVDMLWWLFGGWSNCFDLPFSEFNPGSVAVLAGIDLSDLSRTLIGPAAAPALLQKSLLLAKKSKAAKTSLASVVDGLGRDMIPKLEISASVGTARDLTPVFTAFHNSQQIGPGAEWHAAFMRTTGLEASVEFSLLDLAKQTYWERMLLAGL
jgi:hypothetical protein